MAAECNACEPELSDVRMENLRTIQEAARAVGAKYWQIQRAVKQGRIPSYTPYNSRRLVKLSEVVAYIDFCRQEDV